MEGRRGRVSGRGGMPRTWVIVKKEREEGTAEKVCHIETVRSVVLSFSGF
jgi:hypothetical protein